jgi:integrase/recombinase XerD
MRLRDPLLKKISNSTENALLISANGKRITGNAVYSRLQNLAKKAGLPGPLSLHALRHSVATHLLENGLNLENIGLFLGHKSLESTQIYTHLFHQSNSMS